ncbi:hypothetical protein KIN20_029786 [Parelaphostrongylus tenuis]|uniref:Ribosomal RNA-processing protein 12-like conserved domain-containing protein n=1 Tax=Parelaphostrongylus tenuis TaxID=148309 RepID=A0AAD5WFV9_PARTN|nr:hypothetical protein KIN20_029786 [Parelaphostrongylus tenuis]
MVGKYRHRIQKKARIRIKKGMSSESNPTKHRHREAASVARVRSLSTGVMQAVDDRPETANHLLSKLGGMTIDREQDFSNKSMVSDGAVSRISQFTACTNHSFDSVHRFWKSGSPMQKEVVAVLAAVAELIREHKGSETDVEYFAALLTTLEGSPISEPYRTAAVSFLLQLIIKKVPKEVLQSQFARTVQILYTKIWESSENSEGFALKYLLSVLGVVLRAQPACVWNASSTKNIVVSIAAMCSHGKPWVRTMARRVVRAVLTDPVTAMDNGLHAASSSVGMFVQQQLQEALESKSGDMTAVRYLCLLEGIMHKMPSNLFKQLAEIILRSLAVADRMVKCSALQCLHRCLQRQPCDAALSVEVNVLLVKALRELCPPSEDVTVCAYWMQALAETHVCLTAKDPYRCHALLPSTLEVIVKLFDTGNEQLAQVTYQIIARLIERSVQENENCAKTLLTFLDRALNLHSTPVWKYVLRSEMRLFEVAGVGITGEEFCKAMKTLALLREGNDSSCRQELDFTVGCAVRHVGAPAVLSAIPLGIDADAVVLDTEFTRSWMIPILRVNLHNAPLEFFSSYFLPMAIKIYRRLGSLDPVPQRLYTTLQAQLWDLLPSFCDSPSDIEKSFPQLAPVLGAALTERCDLRPTILSALRHVLRFCLSSDAFPERAEVVSGYAKNFMPLMFNMYTANDDSTDKGVRMAILETIRAYAELTPKKLVAQFIDAAITRATDASDDAVKQARILDIFCALVRSADCNTLGKVMDTINPWFAIDEVQKKAFRILEEISNRRTSPELEPFFLTRSSDFVNALSRPIDSIIPPARAAFCACIQSLLDSIDDLPKLSDFCLKSLDAVVSTLDKSNSTHARSNASKCLQHMLNKLIQVGGENDQHPSAVLADVLSRIYELTTPATSCDNGSVDLCTARSTLVALNIIAQKQLRVLNGGHISRFIAHGCAWIGDGRPPVRILVIRLLRVLVQKLPEYALQQYRDLLLSSIFDGQPTCDVTSKVRKANRLLLEVLVTRFGIDILLKYTSKLEWVKQMKNIEKLSRRKGRQQHEGPERNDSDDGSMSGTGSRLTSRTAGADTILKLLEDSDASESEGEDRLTEMRSRTGSVWLKEDTDMADSTDLLDRQRMILKVTTCDPAKQQKKTARRKKANDFGFKTTKDGKLVIIDDDDDDIKGTKRKRKNGLDEMDDDYIQCGKKAKQDMNSDSDDVDDDESENLNPTVVSSSRASTWRTGGGQGIHRDTSLKSGKGQSSKGKSVKNNKKLQPYSYIPLRRKGVKQDILKVLKSQRKAGKSKDKIN